MGFPPSEVAKLLAECHRRCCVCHRFCGVKIETDHIVPRAEGGPDTIDNAIPVCFECHAEIHSYNDHHPRGRKFRPAELQIHKQQWLQLCRDRPDIFVGATRDSDVGPLQALIDELEFNITVSQVDGQDALGCLFQDEQFGRAISTGSVSMLNEELKQAVLAAYATIGRANEHIKSVMMQEPETNAWAGAQNRAQTSIREARPTLEAARHALLQFLSSDDYEDTAAL